MNYGNSLRGWNGGRCDHCVDIQDAVIESRAGMCTSSVEGSLLLGVWLSRMLLRFGCKYSRFVERAGKCLCSRSWGRYLIKKKAGN